MAYEKNEIGLNGWSWDWAKILVMNLTALLSAKWIQL